MNQTYRLGVPVPDDLPHDLHGIACACIELEREKHVQHWEGGAVLYWGHTTTFHVSLPGHDSHVHRMDVDGIPLTERAVPAERQVEVFAETVRAAGSLTGDERRPDVLMLAVEDYILPGHRTPPPMVRDFADVPGAVERRRVVAVTADRDLAVVRERHGKPRLVIDDVQSSVLSGDSAVRALRVLWSAYTVPGEDGH